ncbi:MAG: inorganic phosphate transporter [Nitrospira sp.]
MDRTPSHGIRVLLTLPHANNRHSRRTSKRTMTELSSILLVTVVLALLFDFSNGWHDCANAVATVVSTRVLSPLKAVLLAGVLNIAGAFFSTAVANYGGGIVFPDAITNTVVAAAMGGAILWNFLVADARAADQFLPRLDRWACRLGGGARWLGRWSSSMACVRFLKR